MSLKFLKEPPPSKRETERSSRWDSIAQQLRDRPNEWALVATKETSAGAGALAYEIRKGGLKAFRDERFTASVRGKDVWASFQEKTSS